MPGQPAPINIWNLVTGSLPTSPQTIFDPVQDLADAVAAHHDDAAGLKGVIEAALVAAMIAGAITSLVPTESNFGGPLAARLAGDLSGPGIRVAINGPMEEYLLRLFPQKHLRANMIVQGITEGVFTDAQILDWCISSGLMQNDINMILTFARSKRFDRATAEDFALIKTLFHDSLMAQIDFQRIDLDAQIANVKLNLAQARKEFKAGATTYSGDLYV
jgi:hypothetical protein